ncbi:hypothetical protein GCM10008106_05550 [Mongoliitalea lutea]|uniref:Transposase DDE domain-containing protein n=1 Tax=Mongoliitalea lutea TaxID=849756 RepID=A0A8J3G492_9BACT|nr:hypothetical protein GCM10008106_05550 [Mongoliitalea lutea]
MIIEHIYGTAKRKWGFNFTDLRGLEKVNGEFALIMTVYNLKRTINILGIPELLQLIQNWKPDYKRVSLALKSSLFGLFKALLAFKTLISKTNELNLILTQVQDYLSTNPLYASEMRFFQKTESFFTA